MPTLKPTLVVRTLPCPYRKSPPCSRAPEDGDTMLRKDRSVESDRVRLRVVIQVTGATRSRDSCPPPSEDGQGFPPLGRIRRRSIIGGSLNQRVFPSARRRPGIKHGLWNKDPVMPPFRSAARSGRFVGHAGPSDRNASEVPAKYILTGMDAKGGAGRAGGRSRQMGAWG